MVPMKWSARFGLGLVAGLVMVFVDDFAFNGEVSPVVIVAMLVAIAATAAGIWGRHGWITTGGAWMLVPLAHLIKHVLSLPDTLHPNTYASILMLAAFTLAITALGTGVGMLMHRGSGRASHRRSGPA